ncbi:MAG: hypothetical protein L0K86_26895 [Actinomycetia bacterium]|nr:hypothetical protein [Actinomycetes bacterium]
MRTSRITGAAMATVAGVAVAVAAGSGTAWAAPGTPVAPVAPAAMGRAAPAFEQSPCFTWTGPGMCVTFSNQELHEWEAAGLIAAAASAAGASEWVCTKVPSGRRKAACKAAVVIVFARAPIALRQAISQGRCLWVKASLNPVGNLIDSPQVVDC